jgi:small subunit ribosomal protein S7
MFLNFKKKKNLHDVDPIYKSRLLNRFVNNWIRKGRKSKSYRVFYSVLYTIQKKTNGIPTRIVEHRVRMVRPLVRVQSFRIRGTVYLVPIEVRQKIGICNSIRWIRASAKTRQSKGTSIALCLAEEIIAAACGVGGSIRKREEVHRIAESNKAFSRYQF